jgi:hypothetical protein
MATSIIFGVFAVPALVLARPDTDGCDTDYYVRYMPDGRAKTFLLRRGKPYQNAFHFLMAFCISLAVVLSMAALVTAPKTAFSDAVWALWLLVILMRYAYHSIFRTWHPTGARWALACVALMCFTPVLACVFTLAVACVLISSPSISLATCACVLPVLAGLAIELALAALVTHSVRANQHLYDATTTYAVPHDGADDDAVHDLQKL